ncbi:MAG: hypothetical protein K2N43_06655, partial [Lachnospiraceae bacterium]|nr:hypothetical protein [Lachnospiraceae bacterium]
ARLSKASEDDVLTIGTVTQKPDTVAEEKEWDAEKKDYKVYKRNRYNRYATVEDLDFPEVTYLTEPERRVYWGSYTPEYLHKRKMSEYRMDDLGFVAEFSPLEDCVPDESVKILITKALGSRKTMEGNVLWLCDHYNREPFELKADKTYIAWIEAREWRHGKMWEAVGSEYSEMGYVCFPQNLTLYTPEGSRIEDPMEMQSIYEVSEGFYETDIGKRFLAISEMTAFIFDTQPVVGTNNTDLLMPFYEGNAWVYEGRYPTEEEYEKGSAVCLAPRIFVENNGLSVGDQVTTRLYFTDAKRQPTVLPGFFFSILGLDGELLEPFEEKVYTIVGLYDYEPTAGGIGADELIVPLNSVQGKMENVVDYGAMNDDNTSFQIPNGSITDFLEASAKNGVDNLTYTFYDRGYSALMEQIQNLKNMSAALLIMGLIAAVILTLQISHIYITKQRNRLSIERMLGMSGKRCRNICLTGILILLLLGTVPGVVAGMAVSAQINIEDVGQEDFNRKYSNLGLAVETEMELSGQAEGDIAVSCGMGVLVILLGMGICACKVKQVLGQEALSLTFTL